MAKKKAEKKDRTLLILGGVAVAGIVAYFLLKKPPEVSARIDSFTISV